MRVLNLCSGTCSVSKPVVKAGHDVVEVDWDPLFSTSHCVDIMAWERPYEPGGFDVIWASPDCTQYNRARTTAKKTTGLGQSRCACGAMPGLDQLSEPIHMVPGNPDSGLLKTRPAVQGLPFVRVD